ncbi:MAG: FtsQ-type POTRA domain-containing protein [Nitrospinae bacterium]|nr:FtsQ-type POTRA domain-containing protein [Nitrospinota bacterium]
MGKFKLNRHGQAELAAPENENGLRKDSGIFTLKQVVVKGTRRLTPEQILQWAALEDRSTPGAPARRVRELDLWQVDLKEMASRLKSHPWIEAVAIERNPPDRLTLTIRERVAWARLEGPSSYLVSGEGMVLQRVSEGDAGPPLPRLVGWGGHPYLPGERIGKAEILRALEILKEAGHCPWALHQGILQVDLSQGERPVITLGNGRKLRFGPTDIRGSWARLRAVSSRMEGAPGMIDLSFKDLVVVGSLASLASRGVVEGGQRESRSRVGYRYDEDLRHHRRTERR